MTTTRMLLTAAAAFTLVVALLTGGSDFETDYAFTKGRGGDSGVGGGAGAGAAGSGGAAGSAGAGSASAGGAGTGGSQGDGGNDKGRSLAAFVASVASEEPPTEEAGPVVSRLGVPCRTLTQTIDIGGQTVPASGVVCRQPDGTWRLNETQSAQRPYTGRQ
jgi:hypothetical protein